MRQLPVLFLLASALHGATPQALLAEAEARARVVAMLGKFVTWPERPGDSARPFVVGVLGNHPFEDQLDRMAQGLIIRNRKVVVRYFQRAEAGRMLECDLLYLCESEEDRLGVLLKILHGHPVLVVGGTPGFAARGVMLNLPIRDGYLKPEVNLKAVREAFLEIHPAFLAKAKAQVVEPR